MSSKNPVVIVMWDRDLRIHNTIQILADARHIKLSNYKQLDSTEFRNQSISSGLFVYNGQRQGKKYFIAFMTILSKYLKKADINRLIESNEADHFIFILPTRKSFKVDNSSKSVEFIIGDECMIVDVPEEFRAQGITHRIVPREELDTFCKTFFITDLEVLPKIYTTDPGIIYSTAKVGDVVEVIYPTQSTSLISGTLRYVIDPPV